jgi:hypothetical protein
VWTDPEPNDLTAIASPKGAKIDIDSHGIDRPRWMDLFEAQAWMIRILHRQKIFSSATQRQTRLLSSWLIYSARGRGSLAASSKAFVKSCVMSYDLENFVIKLLGFLSRFYLI